MATDSVRSGNSRSGVAKRRTFPPSDRQPPFETAVCSLHPARAVDKMKPPVPVVLVVDDEQLIRWSIRTHLARAGYRVEIAETGKQALERFGDDVGIVVLDVRLPDTDGLSVLSEIKRKREGCRVIVMTAYGNPELASEAIHRGAYCVLNKPFDLDVLSEMVGEAFSGDLGPKAQEAPH